MKKIFTLFTVALSSAALAQSFSIYKTNNSQSTITGTITNGYELIEVTTPSNQAKGTFKIVNNTANTLSLSIQRTVEFQNPALVLDGSTTTPNTYFCFGNTCFPSNVSTVSSSDYTILGPAGATSSPFDNSTDNSQPFIIYLEEGAVTGKYFIRYRVFNVNNPSDELTFRYIYNDFAGINEASKSVQDISNVFPNPSGNIAHISFNLTEETPVKIQVHNSLGAMVYNSIENRTSGRNKVNIDCSHYNSGLYFVTITAGDTKITKKLVVNK